VADKSRRSTKSERDGGASVVNGRVASNGNASGGPRRSGLRQARSRNTRHQLVRTALAMWDERGFERGVEETTVEEIAKAAGVTKGTFYFHFAHKEDILLEIGWAAAEAMDKEAEAAMQRQLPAAEIINAALASLARRVSRAPRAAVIRAAAEFARRRHDLPTRPDGIRSFRRVFVAVLTRAVERGELPLAVDVHDVAALLESATMDALVSWAANGETGTVLRHTLQRRAQVILTGASVVYTWRLP
jgi:AcrR family transcriptional regulator